VNENDMLSSPEESVDDAEMPPEDAVVESTLVKREEPGENPLPTPLKKQIKPAVLALGSIGGMLVLCLVMLMILLLLLLPGISAGF
jgi:hypothetical protein